MILAVSAATALLGGGVATAAETLHQSSTFTTGTAEGLTNPARAGDRLRVELGRVEYSGSQEFRYVNLSRTFTECNAAVDSRGRRCVTTTHHVEDAAVAQHQLSVPDSLRKAWVDAVVPYEIGRAHV